jgi:hypothetical protein
MFRPIHHLKSLHARLERELARERKARVPDATRITRMKKLKLAIKDRLTHSARPGRPTTA